MRPARKGPENRQEIERAERVGIASMRPARKGPENTIFGKSRTVDNGCFNEAGPQGAGKPAKLRASCDCPPRFNEAGPQGAGKRITFCILFGGGVSASMRPARKGPENANRNARGAGAEKASMRPARKGPENL